MNESSPSKPVCPKCGTALGPYAPEGECPRCMLAAAVDRVAAPRESAADSPQLDNEVTRNGASTEILRDATSSGGFTSAATVAQPFGDHELLEEIGRACARPAMSRSSPMPSNTRISVASCIEISNRRTCSLMSMTSPR